MKCPLITMTAITGKPTKNQIFEYLCQLKNVGIEQAMLYPRSGCELEYLSEEWFTAVGHFIQHAKELGMSIWLYDDFNWPSGDAGGRVTSIPEYRLKAIDTKGENLGEISCKSRHNSGLFGEKFFPNLLNPNAVDYFIKCTHEEYYKRFSEDFGTVVKGIFTDEPSIGYCCENGCIPYYDELENDYFEFCHRDFYDDMKSSYSLFYKNAITVISNRFKSSYIDKIHTWCTEHNILMTGHFMSDNNPFESTKHSGSPLKNLSSFSLPGIDEIFTDFEDICEMSLLASCEYASGENGAMAELFALGPCDISFAKRRAMIYLCACHKIDHYFLAISPLDMRGNLLVKDYFNDFTNDQPNFEGMEVLSREAIKASMLAKEDFEPDVYVRFPFDYAAKNMTRGYDTVPFLNLLNKLTYNQIQWKYIVDEKVQAPIIELDDSFTPTINSSPFDIEKIPHKVIVTDENGDTPSGIFVRKFKNGDFVAINLFGDEKEYWVNKKRVLLKKYDVYFSNEQDVKCSCEVCTPDFDVTYIGQNIIRTMHVNNQEDFIIDCECDTQISFALRNGVSASVDGVKIAATNNAHRLPRGMKALYRTSEKITLSKGTHVLKAEKDFKYLPSILLLGDFNCFPISGDVCNVTLSQRNSSYVCGNKIYTYGGAEFTCRIRVPKNACGFEIVGAEAFTKAYLNDTPLGKRAFSPFYFEIDKSMNDTEVELKITQLSSIAPLFGDVDYWDKNASECGWRGTPSPQKEFLGFSSIKWHI